uniref:Opsin 4 n=1 Tax=Cryptocotyle lingua TaxID=66766 RepID=A0A7U0TJB3_9TREM|nr:opsin 4 [Cryptocotyle lingua]
MMEPLNCASNCTFYDLLQVHPSIGEVLLPFWYNHTLPNPIHVKLASTYMAIVSLIGFIGNLLIVVVFTCWTPKRTSQDLLVINLAIGDALFAVIDGFLLKSLSGFATHWTYGSSGCTLYGFTSGIFGFVSLGSMTFIAIERYYGAVRVKAHTGTKKRAIWILPSIWIWSAIWPSLPFFGIGHWVLEGFQTSCTFDYISNDLLNRFFTASLFIGGFLVPATATVIAYSAVYIILQQSSRKLHHMFRSKGFNYAKGYQIRQMRLARTSCIAFVLFVMSWGPYATVALIALMGYPNHLTNFTTELPGLFAKTSTVYNPFLFATQDRKFRKVVALHLPLLQRFLSHTRQESSVKQTCTKQRSLKGILSRLSRSSISTTKGANAPSDELVALNRRAMNVATRSSSR